MGGILIPLKTSTLLVFAYTELHQEEKNPDLDDFIREYSKRGRTEDLSYPHQLIVTVLDKLEEEQLQETKENDHCKA